MKTTTQPTARDVRAELLEAFRELDQHGTGRCSCCEDGPATIEAALACEARYAVDRYRPGDDLACGLDDQELNGVELLVVRDAIAAARLAIIERVAAAVAGGRWNAAPGRDRR